MLCLGAWDHCYLHMFLGSEAGFCNLSHTFRLRGCRCHRKHYYLQWFGGLGLQSAVLPVRFRTHGGRGANMFTANQEAATVQTDSTHHTPHYTQYTSDTHTHTHAHTHTHTHTQTRAVLHGLPGGSTQRVVLCCAVRCCAVLCCVVLC